MKFIRSFFLNTEYKINKYKNIKNKLKKKIKYLKFKKILETETKYNNIIFFTDNNLYNKKFNRYMLKKKYKVIKKEIYLLNISSQYGDNLMDISYIYQNLHEVLHGMKDIFTKYSTDNMNIENILNNIDNYILLCKNNINNFMTYCMDTGELCTSFIIDKQFCLEHWGIYKKEIYMYVNDNMTDTFNDLLFDIPIYDDIITTEYNRFQVRINNIYNLIVYLDNKNFFNKKYVKFIDK
jgi:hypothetical protein